MKRRGFLAGLLSLFAAPELPSASTEKFFVGIAMAAAGGDVTIFTDVTLTQDLYVKNLYVANGAKINVNGHRVYAYESIAFEGNGIMVRKDF